MDARMHAGNPALAYPRRRRRNPRLGKLGSAGNSGIQCPGAMHLREPTKLGGRIEFLPQASLWSNVSAVKRLASGLTDRANQAKSARQSDTSGH